MTKLIENYIKELQENGYCATDSEKFHFIVGLRKAFTLLFPAIAAQAKTLKQFEESEGPWGTNLDELKSVQEVSRYTNEKVRKLLMEMETNL